MEHGPTDQPMRGRRRTQNILDTIDDGLEEVSFMIETSIGHAMLSGAMTAEEGMEALDSYARAFGHEKGLEQGA